MSVSPPAIGSILHVDQVTRVTQTPLSMVHRNHVLSLHRSRGGYGLGDEERRFDGAALILLPAGDRDQHRLHGTDRAWWAQFDGSAVRGVRGGAELDLGGGSVRASRLRRLTPGEDRTAGAWFRELVAAWRQGTPVAGLIVRARVLDLLALWAGPTASADDAVERLRGRIELRACDPDLGMAALMRGLNVTPAVLTAAFRRRFGATPVAYRLRQRLLRARELLVHEPQPLDAIAQRCGFSDAGYLCRVFRQHLGTSPRAYARQCGARQDS